MTAKGKPSKREEKPRGTCQFKGSLRINSREEGGLGQSWGGENNLKGDCHLNLEKTKTAINSGILTKQKREGVRERPRKKRGSKRASHASKERLAVERVRHLQKRLRRPKEKN